MLVGLLCLGVLMLFTRAAWFCDLVFMVLVAAITVGHCLRDCVAYVRLLVFATCLLGLPILVVAVSLIGYCGGFVNSVG